MQFFPNTEYNKAKRKKFWVLMIVAMLALFGLLTVCLINDPKSAFTVTVAFFILFLLILLPSVLKSYPVNGKPVIEVGEKQVIYNGKYVVELKDIVGFKLNVFHPCASRIPTEIEDELTEVGKKLDEEIRFGYVDLVIKGEKKEETLYGTVLDCVGAAQALIDFGVKEYVCFVSWKKHVITPAYKFIRKVSDEENVINVSKKNRRKQLL